MSRTGMASAATSEHGEPQESTQEPAGTPPQQLADTQPDEPAGTHPEELAATPPQEPADTHQQEPAATQPDEPADTHPEEPAGTPPEGPAGTLPEEPAGIRPEEPAGTHPEEPARTHHEELETAHPEENLQVNAETDITEPGTIAEDISAPGDTPLPVTAPDIIPKPSTSLTKSLLGTVPEDALTSLSISASGTAPADIPAPIDTALSGIVPDGTLAPTPSSLLVAPVGDVPATDETQAAETGAEVAPGIDQDALSKAEGTDLEALPDAVLGEEAVGEAEEKEKEESTAVVGEGEDVLTKEPDVAPLDIATIPEEEDEGEEEEEDEEEEEEEEEEAITEEEIREDLLLQCQALIEERDKIQNNNLKLQQKLFDYFQKKKSDEAARRTVPPELPKPVADQDQNYQNYMEMLDDVRLQYATDAVWYHGQVEELRAQCQELVDKVNDEWMVYQDQKKDVVLSVITGKRSRQAAEMELDELQAKEQQKEELLIQVRLENIKLKNRINRFEQSLKAKEELADGLHLIDFEQLKIENQTYNEKIEERNEELLKLRKKITSTVQVLSHLKEKLQFVQAENQVKKEKLRETEASVAQKRDVLTKTKQARDSLRMSNVKLQQKCGLLGNEMLLRDFEGNVDATEELSQRLENLKRRHAELTLNCCGIKKKIEATKSLIQP